MIYDVLEKMQNIYDYDEYRGLTDNPVPFMTFASFCGVYMAIRYRFGDKPFREGHAIVQAEMLAAHAGISIGLGDTIAKLTKTTGLDKLAEAYTSITGKDCGCAKRQARLNELVPYSTNK